MQKPPLRPAPSAAPRLSLQALASAALVAALAGCGGGGDEDVQEPGAGSEGQARVNWDELLWDEDDWS